MFLNDLLPLLQERIMRLFKYTQKRFADDLLKGKIYLPNMRSYHNLEHHGKAVGDSEEATNVQNLTGQFDLAENQIPGIRGGPGSTGTVHIKDSTFITGFTDLYAFCVSTVCTESLMKKFSDMNQEVGKPPYDACLEIINTGRFRRRLRQTALEQCKLILFTDGKCKYSKTIGNVPVKNPQLEPRHFLEKPPEFEYQEEYRFGFVLHKTVNTVAPYYQIDNPALGAHFSEVKI